jgi:hypothetical protein
MEVLDVPLPERTESMSPRYIVRSTPAAGNGEGFVCPHVHEGLREAVKCFLRPPTRPGLTKRVQRIEGYGDTWTNELDAKEREKFIAEVAKQVVDPPATGLRALRAAIANEMACVACALPRHDGPCGPLIEAAAKRAKEHGDG